MANVKFKNLASSTLQTALTTNSTVVVVDSADVSKFPTIAGDEYFIIVLVDSAGEFEIMRVVGINNNSFTVIRAQEGTSAKSFAIGDKVEHRLTAESLINIVEEASITKPHTSTDADQYGHATSSLFSHVKVTDDPVSAASAILGIAISPYAVKTRFDQLAGATNTTAITTSSTFTVPETGNYEVICVGGGGNGGTGGGAADGFVDTNASPDYEQWTLYLGSGGGAGGGGAGQTVTQNIHLTKGEVITVTVGGAGGNTTFGTYVTALAGSRGNNGGNASGCGCSCGDMSNYYFGGAGSGGTGGYSYGSTAVTGNGGTTTTGGNGVSGGIGGHGGVSLEGTYGNGGNGGNGQGIHASSDCYVSTFGTTTGSSGTQGCVKIRLVLGA